MKDIYKKVLDLCEEIGSNMEAIDEDDNMSIIIGIADCDEEKILGLTAVGEGIGIREMVIDIGRQLIEATKGEFDDTERVDAHLS